MIMIIRRHRRQRSDDDEHDVKTMTATAAKTKTRRKSNTNILNPFVSSCVRRPPRGGASSLQFALKICDHGGRVAAASSSALLDRLSPEDDWQDEHRRDPEAPDPFVPDPQVSFVVLSVGPGESVDGRGESKGIGVGFGTRDRKVRRGDGQDAASHVA